MTSRTSLTSRTSALVAGVVLLAAMVAFTVGLPRLTAGESIAADASLPDRLPGGWTALALVQSPEGVGTDDYDAAQQRAVSYANGVLDDVYGEEPVEFQAYLDDEQRLATMTRFDAAGGAFAPPIGVVDPAEFGLPRAPAELTREGDATCIANYQTGAAAAPAEGEDLPVSVSCQAPLGEQTLQVGTLAVSLEDTVALLDATVAELS